MALCNSNLSQVSPHPTVDADPNGAQSLGSPMAEPELNTEVHYLPAEGREWESQREHSQLHACLWLHLFHAVPGACGGGVDPAWQPL